MSTAITGVATTGLVLGTATVPAAGDYVTGGGLQVTAQALENDVVNLLEWAVPAGNRAVTKWFDLEPFDRSSTNFSFDATTGIWQDSGTGAGLFYPVPAPHRSILVAVNARIQGNAGHAAFPGGRPANMPFVDLWQREIATGTVTTVALATDATATAGAYEAEHTFGFVPSVTNTAWVASTAYVVGDFRENGAVLYMCTHAGTSASSGGPTGTTQLILDGTCVWTYAHGVNGMPLDRANFRYWLRLYAESGAGSVAGMRVMGLQVGFLQLVEQGQ